MTIPISMTPFAAELAVDFFNESFDAWDEFDAMNLRERLGSGQFFSIAPENADEQRLHKLHEGGLFPFEDKVRQGKYLIQSVTNSSEALAAVITAKLAAVANPILWIHEPHLTVADLGERSLPFKKLDNNIYLTYDQGLSDKNCVNNLIKFSLLSWHFLGVATSGDSNISCVNTLISKALFIVVGAYDGEGFLIWFPAT